MIYPFNRSERIEHAVNLLQRLSLGLGEPETADKEHAATSTEKVVPSKNRRIHKDGHHKRHKDTNGPVQAVSKCNDLGTRTHIGDFSRVNVGNRAPAIGISSLEDKHKRNDTGLSMLVGEAHVAFLVNDVVALEQSTHNVHGETHNKSTRGKDTATAQTVNEQDCQQSDHQDQNVASTTGSQRDGGASYARLLENGRRVVCDGVRARKSSTITSKQGKQSTLQIGATEAFNVRTIAKRALHLNFLTDALVLVAHFRIVHCRFVQLGKHQKSLFFAPLVDEPARRVGQKVSREQKHTHNQLHQEGRAPCPVIVQVGGAKINEITHNRAYRRHGTEQGNQSATDIGRRNFSVVEWNGICQKTFAQTHKQTTRHQQTKVVANGLEKSPNSKHTGTKKNGVFTAKVIFRNKPGCQQKKKGSWIELPFVNNLPHTLPEAKPPIVAVSSIMATKRAER